MKTYPRIAKAEQLMSAVAHEMVVEALEYGQMFQAIILQEKHAAFSRSARKYMGLES